MEERINLNNFREIISYEVIQERVKQMAQEIDRDYMGENVLLVCILKGAVIFTTDLMMQLKVPAKIDFMKVSSYEGTNSTGVLNVKMDLGYSVRGMNVIICEDIIDTGYTLSYLRDYLMAQNPKSLKIAVFADKKDRREKEVPVDYVGFSIPDEFVIGYGLDYNEVGRNIPYLGAVIDPNQEIITLTRTKK